MKYFFIHKYKHVRIGRPKSYTLTSSKISTIQCHQTQMMISGSLILKQSLQGQQKTSQSSLSTRLNQKLQNLQNNKMVQL